MPVTATSERLARILTLVPWVLAHPEATVDEVCRRFSITRAELNADVDLLMMCGLPPFGPGDLIEASISGDRIVIRMADFLSRPLRLTHGEAISLLVMGRAVAALPGIEEAEALTSALEKLGAAVGQEAAEAARRITVELETTSSEELALLRAAISGKRRIRMTYYSHGRDEISERVVDPLHVFGARGVWYLAAFDVTKGDERMFRVDRIRRLAETGEPAEPPEGFDPSRFAAGPTIAASPEDLLVSIELGPAAAWVAEVTPNDGVEKLPDGWIRLTLRTGHTAWLARLLVRLGDAARAIEPPELAEDVRDLALRMLARYSG